MDFTKKGVADIRQMLIDEFDLSEDEVNNIKGKANLINCYNSMASQQNNNNNDDDTDMDEEINEVFAALEEDDDSFAIINNSDVEFNKEIDRSDPSWSEWALDHLAKDEFDTDDKGNKIPKTDGLRRLVEDLIGTIIDIDTEVVQAPNELNHFTATVKARITVMTDAGEMRYAGIADSKRSDCAPPYDKFVSAIAETRAEGRAYRKILGLKNTVAFEETMGVQQQETATDGVIHTSQINFIDMMCMRSGRGMNINVQKLFHKVSEKQYNNVNKYSDEDAQKITSALNTWQSKPEDIPEDIRGYDNNWKSTFA